jgi:predicted patatin/cPLA2 family phospholipase
MFKLSLLVILFLFSACSRPTPPPPEAMHLLPWGSVDLNTSKESSPFDIKKSLGDSLLYKIAEHSDANVSYNILAISGGGSQGVYGCGVLDGWYQRGDMPKFDVVTGISTGSIISSFIFLGAQNISYISKIYRSITTSDIYHYNFFKIFGGSSVSSTTPLKEMLKKHITQELLDKIAVEYKRGRRLYIGTTNIDTGHLVVWDMTAIAASQNPDKLQLYRDIIYASCAIPGLFDPHYFEIEYQGEKYYQMHIDGGMNSYAFMVGIDEDWNDILNITPESRLDVSIYVLSNRQYRYKKQREPLKNDNAITILTAVAKNSVDLMYDRSMYRLYKASWLRGYHFNYTGIDDDVVLKYMPHEFNPKEMQELYLQGYEKGLHGVAWQHQIIEDEILRHR